jgi:hypothetical protein
VTNIVCAQCGAAIDPETDPSFCPSCGSGDRHIEVSDEVGLVVHERYELKRTRIGDKKPHEEILRGGDLYRATGEWRTIDRHIDRDNDDYKKVVTDSAGNVVYYQHHPLSEHQGHGSAKHRKPKK